MIVKRYVKKSTIYIIAAVMAFLTAGALYLGVFYRFSYGAKYKDYSSWSARVVSLDEHKHEDSDDHVYYHYSAALRYNVAGTVYTPVTDEVFSEENVPEEGDSIPIFYNNRDPGDYVLVKYDWLTKSYIPLTDKGDIWIFTAFLLLGFILFLIPMNLENDQIQGIMIGSGLFLIGLDSIVMGIIMRNFQMFFLIIFGILGAIILFRYIFIPKEKRQKADAVSASLRLFKVVDTYMDPQTGVKTVVFSMPENNGLTHALFSLDDIYNQYHYGDMYQIDKTVLSDFYQERQINGSYTININGLDPSHIQPLNPILKRLFSRA